MKKLTQEEKDKRKEARRQKWEDKFIADAIKKHGDRYDYSLVIGNYVGAHIEVEIICGEHGVFEQTPSNHLSGYGCKKCDVDSRRLTIEIFISRAIAIHGDGYDYSLVVYIDYFTPVEIICPIHGAFTQQPLVHLSGGGCPDCANESQKLTKEEVLHRFKKYWGEMWDYSLMDYKNIMTPITIICPIHGPFFRTPNAHINGRGCSSCTGSSAELIMYNVLTTHNIKYIAEHKPIPEYPRLAFDSFIPQFNLYIELDGAQHLKYIDFFHPNPGDFERQQERDEIKNKWCNADPNIHLLRIPHTEFHRIEEIIMNYISNLLTISKNTI